MRFGVDHFLRRQAQFLRLANNQVQMTVIGKLIFDHFAVLVLQDRLLDRHHRTVGRYQSPTVAPVADVKSQLRDHQLRPRLVHLDRKIMLQLRRAHMVAHQVANRLSPCRNFHHCSSLVKPVDKAFLKQFVDERIVKKSGPRYIRFAFPCQHGLDARWIGARGSLKIPETVIVCLLQHRRGADICATRPRLRSFAAAEWRCLQYKL